MDIGLTALAVAAVVIVERLRPLLSRIVTLREKREEPLLTSAQPVQIPKDLIGLALMESEPWAQREMLDGMRELYEQCADWNMVRARYGVAKD